MVKLSQEQLIVLDHLPREHRGVYLQRIYQGARKEPKALREKLKKKPKPISISAVDKRIQTHLASQEQFEMRHDMYEEGMDNGI